MNILFGSESAHSTYFVQRSPVLEEGFRLWLHRRLQLWISRVALRQREAVYRLGEAHDKVVG